MNDHSALDALAERYGIISSFYDLQGREHFASPQTKMALLRAIGIPLDDPIQAGQFLADIRAEDQSRIMQREIILPARKATSIQCHHQFEWHVILENAETSFAEGRAQGNIFLPELPSGVHQLFVKSDATEQVTTLLVAPQSTPTIQSLAGNEKCWGVNGALYGLHSKNTAGLGDFSDLAKAATELAKYGASFLGINPVHALGWADQSTYSPYSPSHRGYLNTAHIALDQVPSLAEDPGARHIISQARYGGDLHSPINYYEYYQSHKRALSQLYELFQKHGEKQAERAFSEFCLQGGDSLERFALFEAISEEAGADFRQWPEELKSSNSPAVTSTRIRLAQRIKFHQWLQWLSNHQLRLAQFSAQHAGMKAGLYLDLAVGARKSGAEAWCENDIIAKGISIGAPPDQLSPGGQNWDLAGHSPIQASKTRYAAFRKILGNTMNHCGIMRIDHVLGMNRSFWIPDDGSAGGYIKQPFESLLAIIAIEAEKAGTIVIGEDLGLVPEGFRDVLKHHGLYSYSVLQYEKDHTGAIRQPHHLAAQSLACFGTHDTPTLNGYLHSHDIDWWNKLGWIDGSTAEHSRGQRQYEISGLMGEHGNSKDYDFAFGKVHECLANCPASMVSVQLDDVFGTIEAQNIPGTIEEHPNWRRRYPVGVDEMLTIDRLSLLQQIMQSASRNPDNEYAAKQEDE